MAATLLTNPIVSAAIWKAWLETGLQPRRRPFHLDAVELNGERQPLHWSSRPFGPFAMLTDAQRLDAAPGRTVLLVPPLSGAFPMVVRDMVASFATVARVRIVEWLNARYASGAAGPFLLDDQIALIAEAIRRCDEPPHVAALCQGGAPSFAAAAMVAAEAEGAGPASISLIASPIRPCAAASPLSSLIDEKTRSMVEASMLWRRTPEGDLRQVYPAEAHVAALAATLAAQRPDRDEFSAMILDSIERPPKGPRFLELVTTYMDLPAEFVLDNLTRLYLAPTDCCAVARWRGARLDYRALDQTPMAVVEGGKDSITAPGQTRAAFKASPGRGAQREAILLKDSGHFSLFYGPVWRTQVFPRLLSLMSKADKGSPPAARRSPAGPSLRAAGGPN